MSAPSSKAGGVFVVKTCHGTTVGCNTQSGRIVHSPQPAQASGALILFIPPGATTAGFLMSRGAGTTALRLASNPPAAIVALRLQHTGEPAQVAFCDPFTGRYLCAAPPVAGVTESELVMDRDDRGAWETFSLITEDANQGPGAVTAMAAISRWAAHPVTGPQLFATIEGGVAAGEASAFDAFCRLLPDDQLAWLAPTMLGRPDAVANLAATFPDDTYATSALPALHNWIGSRSKSSGTHITSKLDGLSVAGLDGHYVSFPHMCNAYARRCVPPRHDVCILATARNEGLYLLEWIAYHRSIGVDGFFIYSNDNNDESDRLLSVLAQAGVITWVNSEVRAGGSAQPKAYGHALGVAPEILDYRWVLIIDLDEFFAFDGSRFKSINEYIAWQEARPVDAIALNWLVYGSNGEANWRDAPLMTRFTRRLPWLDPHIKTLARTNKIMQSRPHHPVLDARHGLLTRDAAGRPHVSANGPSFSAEPEATTAWINHYFLKSAEEFLWKFSRNRGDHAVVRDVDPAAIEQTFLDMFVSQHESPHIVLDDRILSCGSSRGEHLEALRQLPGVAEATQAIQRRYHEAIGKLKAGLGKMPLFHKPDSSAQKLARFIGL